MDEERSITDQVPELAIPDGERERPPQPRMHRPQVDLPGIEPPAQTVVHGPEPWERHSVRPQLAGHDGTWVPQDDAPEIDPEHPAGPATPAKCLSLLRLRGGNSGRFHA